MRPGRYEGKAGEAGPECPLRGGKAEGKGQCGRISAAGGLVFLCVRGRRKEKSLNFAALQAARELRGEYCSLHPALGFTGLHMLKQT